MFPACYYAQAPGCQLYRTFFFRDTCAKWPLSTLVMSCAPGGHPNVLPLARFCLL